MIRQFIPTLLVASALLGCVSEKTVLTGQEADALVAQIAKSDVGPGSEQVDGFAAAAILGDVCVATAPSFRNAPAVMAKMPFRQHPGTGTYYHQTLDLSVKLLPKRCSMVFTSKDEPSQLGIAIATSAAMAGQSTGSMGLDPDTGAASTLAKNGATIAFEPMGRSNGRNWYRAVVIAP